MKRILKNKLRNILADLSEGSLFHRMYDTSRKNALTNGRGAVMLFINSPDGNMATATENIVYMQTSVASSSDFAPAQKLINKYDPQTEFVVIISANIGKKYGMMPKLIRAQTILDAAAST